MIKNCLLQERKGETTTATQRIEQLYNLSEVEKLLGVSRETLLNYIRSGKLEALKVGGKWKVRETTLKQVYCIR